MIKHEDAIRVARSLIGTPYAELGCIGLIVKIIRTASGGVTDYRCQGTNWLWESVKNSGKYRHLTWQQEGLKGARAGMLAFKRYGMDDEGHVGLVTGDGTVIHSSSVNGRGVVETPLTAAEGWDLLAVHRYIMTAADAAESEGANVTAYKMQVKLIDETSSVNVRKGPGLRYEIVGRLGHGAVVTVQAESDRWAFVTYGDSGSGYVSTDYLTAYTEPEEDEPENVTTTIINEETGTPVVLVGIWRVAND